VFAQAADLNRVAVSGITRDITSAALTPSARRDILLRGNKNTQIRASLKKCTG
jgi:hypothetical protein